MAKRILVPVDLKSDGDAVVNLVYDVAHASGATVRLLHVAPVPEERRGEFGRVVVFADQEMARVETESIEAMRALEERLDGVVVERVVRFGAVAEEIEREADAFGADLIAFETPRVGRLAGLLGGGVAGRLLRRSERPVMLLRRGVSLPAAA
jgi:nucleotide-binding universal stress UspA family protein